jgi:hypothetical protein
MLIGVLCTHFGFFMLYIQRVNKHHLYFTYLTNDV